LRKEFGSGYSVDSLERFRAFFLEYPVLLKGEKIRRTAADFSELNFRCTAADFWQCGKFARNACKNRYRI
jgi:hypothetical protein